MINYKKYIKICILIVIIIAILSAIGMVVLKYETEGEENLPFNIIGVDIISTADALKTTDENNNINLNLVQLNDIYFNIQKNENYKKNEIIKNIKIENLITTKTPQLGTAVLSKIIKNEHGINIIKEEYFLENTINYTGTQHTNLENLEVANQGGLIGFRYIIKDLSNIPAPQDAVTYDGTLLKSSVITQEQLNTTINFDMIIEVKSGTKYKANITLNLPIGNILENGVEHSADQININEIVFKRI